MPGSLAKEMGHFRVSTLHWVSQAGKADVGRASEHGGQLPLRGSRCRLGTGAFAGHIRLVGSTWASGGRPRLPHSLLQSSLNCGGGGACSGAHPSADRRGDGGPENQASCPPGAPWGNLELGGRSGGPEVDAASAFEPVDFENCPQALELAWQ